MPDTARTLRVSDGPHPLMGKKLEGFEVKELTEVVKVGRGNPESVGCFFDAELARSFARHQGGDSYSTREIYALTNGKVAYVLVKDVTLMDESEVRANLRTKILEGLNPADRRIVLEV